MPQVRALQVDTEFEKLHGVVARREEKVEEVGVEMQ
jgi:hypothetical protein